MTSPSDDVVSWRAWIPIQEMYTVLVIYIYMEDYTCTVCTFSNSLVKCTYTIDSQCIIHNYVYIYIYIVTHTHTPNQVVKQAWNET